MSACATNEQDGSALLATCAAPPGGDEDAELLVYTGERDGFLRWVGGVPRPASPAAIGARIGART